MFARSLDLVEECGLTHLHVFPFSPRPGTPAARMPPACRRDIVKDRARRLREKGEAALRRHLDAQVGATRNVLTEFNAIGHTEHFTPVRLDASVRPGIDSRTRRHRARRTATARSVTTDVINIIRTIGTRAMTDSVSPEHFVTSMEALERLYGEPFGPSLVKESDRITTPYRAFIEAAPFFALASGGPDGFDCSPRGDAPGFVRVADEKTLLIPDRRGNNRIDTLRNIIHDPRVALLFLIPGCGETIRVNGRASISTDPALAQSFVIEGKAPRTVIVVAVDRIYYQCAKAIVRSKLWDASRHVERKSLPSAGTILADLTQGKMGGPEHDRTAPERLKATLY